MMDQSKMKEAAKSFDVLLRKYSIVDQEAKLLYGAMAKLMLEALAGKITTPLENRAVPGRFFFDEGNLRKYPDLEDAYVRFKVEITGGKDSVISQVARQMEDWKQTATR